MENETEYLLLDDYDRTIAHGQDHETLRLAGRSLANINGEHYYLATVIETICPPTKEILSPLETIHPWLLDHGHTASIQELLQRIKGVLAELQTLPLNQLQYFGGPLFGIIRGIRSKFSDEEISTAFIEIDGFSKFGLWDQFQTSMATQYDAMCQLDPGYNGDLDASIASWFITRDDRELLFVINQANLAQNDIRKAAARWMLDSLNSHADVHATLTRLGYTPAEANRCT